MSTLTGKQMATIAHVRERMRRFFARFKSVDGRVSVHFAGIKVYV